MRLDIRTKTLLWLVAVLMPVFGAALFAFHHVESRLSQQTEEQLSNTLRLEAARLSDELSDYERDLLGLAAGSHVREFTAGVVDARAGRPVERIGGVARFEVIDPSSNMPLQELAERLKETAVTTGAEAVEFKLVDTDGRELGKTDGFSWVPADTSQIATSLTTNTVVFGDAFANADSEARLGMVAPIVAPDGRIVGALLAETRLGPIVDLVLEHQEFGESIEAHIAQPTAGGDAQFITPLRFEPAAAFNKTVPAATGKLIIESMSAPIGRIVHATDYRDVDSILAIETIEPVGWGLVVKIDSSEASAPIDEVRELIAMAALVAIAAVLLAWLTFLSPLSRRLSSTARAARRVASGGYMTPIGDRSRDEIGELARSIDQLATDLDTDIKMRAGAEQQLREQASHDALTGLFNRSFAEERVADLCESSNDALFSLLFLDLDGFKTVNDSYGHPVGDEILQQVATRLVSSADESMTVARWGGDEFVLIAPGVGSIDAEALALTVADLFNEPMVSTVGRHSIQCSVGQSTFSAAAGLSADEVLHDADAEMFRKKQASKGLSVVSSETLRRVERALDENRIEVWYQPVVEVGDDDSEVTVGVEALVRLRDVDGSLVPPSDFLPAIHDNHLGSALDAVVLEQSLADLADWRARGLVDNEFSMAVNMTGVSGRASSYPMHVADALEHAGIEPEALVLELSEQTSVVDQQVVDELRRHGVKIAIDDLGVQNSNLDRLNDLEPDVIKIDRRWTTHPDEPADAAMMASLAMLCLQRGAICIAEGVESKRQLDALRSLGLTQFQGYLLGRPQTAADFVDHVLGARVDVLAGR